MSFSFTIAYLDQYAMSYTADTIPNQFVHTFVPLELILSVIYSIMSFISARLAIYIQHIELSSLHNIV